MTRATSGARIARITHAERLIRCGANLGLSGGSVNSSIRALEAHRLLIPVGSEVLEGVGATRLATGIIAKVACVALACIFKIDSVYHTSGTGCV